MKIEAPEIVSWKASNKFSCSCRLRFQMYVKWKEFDAQHFPTLFVARDNTHSWFLPLSMWKVAENQITICEWARLKVRMKFLQLNGKFRFQNYSIQIRYVMWWSSMDMCSEVQERILLVEFFEFQFQVKVKIGQWKLWMWMQVLCVNYYHLVFKYRNSSFWNFWIWPRCCNRNSSEGESLRPVDGTRIFGNRKISIRFDF